MLGRAFRRLVAWIGAVLVFVAVWELAATMTRGQKLPELSQIGGAVVAMWHERTLVHDMVISVFRFTTGWQLGALFGIPLGLLTGRERRLIGPMLEFNLNATRAVPVIALVPLVTMWFGIDERAKLFLVAWGTFFPIWVNTHNGVRSVNPNYLNAARSLGTGRPEIWWRVLLPHVSEAILTGLRVSIGVGMICIVAAELVGSYDSGFFSQGLGYRIRVEDILNRYDRMTACIFLFGLLGWLLDRAFVIFARPIVRFLFDFDPARSTLRVGTSAGS